LAPPILTKEIREKLEQSIVERLLSSKSFQIPDFVIQTLADKLDLSFIVDQVRSRIPKPENGKDAVVTDDQLSSIVVQVLEKVKTLIDVKNGEDGRPGSNGTNGEDGRNGTNGTHGEDGRPGVDGHNGLTGPIGLQGPVGENGRI